MFRPDAEFQLRRSSSAGPLRGLRASRGRLRRVDHRLVALGPGSCAGMKFMVGEPMKEATNLFCGSRYSSIGRADLRDHAAVEHHDLVGEGHRLDLIVGDVDHGRRKILVELGDLDPHLHPQHGVEVGKRLVEEEDLRLAHQGPADGDALALAAGELRRLPVEQRLELEHARDLFGALLRSRPSAPWRRAGRRRCSGAPSYAGRARRTGTPWRCCAWPAARR